jgi:hypothetical protein
MARSVTSLWTRGRWRLQGCIGWCRVQLASLRVISVKVWRARLCIADIDWFECIPLGTKPFVHAAIERLVGASGETDKTNCH